MPVSVHARGDDARSPRADAAVRATFAELHRLEALFSKFRATSEVSSEVSRLREGTLRLDECSDEVRSVHRLCLTARERTADRRRILARVPLTDGTTHFWANAA